MAVDINIDSRKKASPSTGIISGGALSINGGNPALLDIAEGKGFVVNFAVFPNTVTLVEWTAKIGVAITNILTTPATDIAIDINGDVVQQASYTRSQLRSVILLGGVDHRDNTIIRNIFPIQVPSYGGELSVRDLAQAVGDINISGNLFTPNGANRKLNKSAGQSFSFGRNTVVSATDPHVISQSSLTQLTFSYVYDNGSGVGKFDAATTDINPNIFDDGSGTLASVPTNDFTFQRFLLFPNSNSIFIQPSTTVFNTLKEAIAGLASANFPSLSGVLSAMVRGVMIIKQGATALNNANQAVFVAVDRFGGLAGTGGVSSAVEWGEIVGTLSNQTDLQTVLDSGLFTVELIDVLTTDIYFPDAGSIDTQTLISGTATLAIEKNNVAYTLGGAIAQGDKITFTASAASVWNLEVQYD